MKTPHLNILVLALGLACLVGGVAQAQMVSATHVATHHDNVPRFCNDPNDNGNPNVTAVSSGNWSAPGTWSTNQVPASGARVSIPNGVTVTYDADSTADIDCIEVGDGGGSAAHLRFATDRDTTLRINNIQVLPGAELTIGTASTPVEAGSTAEIVFRNTPLDTAGRDPEQFGKALGAFGKITIHGTPKNPTFVAAAPNPTRPGDQAPQSGDTTLYLDTPVSGWQVGDRIILPDSREPDKESEDDHLEAVFIESIASDGRSLTLTAPLQHDHPGARDLDGNWRFFPHIVNMTRNVVFRSEDTSIPLRGHTMLFGRVIADVRFAQFVDLGRTTTNAIDNTTFNSDGSVNQIGTNQIARYPLHTHHVLGPMPPISQYQYTLMGNVVDGALKWGMTIHGSHYGLIEQNIVYGAQGAGVATEDGSESYNVFSENLAMGTLSPQSCDSGESKEGLSGDGFWFAGTNNTVTRNVSANNDCFGFTYFMQRNNDNFEEYVRYPTVQGANPMMANPANSIEVNVREVPLLEFSDNELYNVREGVNIWDLGTIDPRFPDENFITDLKMWHWEGVGIFSYHADDLTIDRLVAIGDASNISPTKALRYRVPRAAFSGARSERNTVIINADIQGVLTGAEIATDLGTPDGEFGLSVIENSYIRAHEGILVVSPNDEDKSSDRFFMSVDNDWGGLPVTTDEDGPDHLVVMEYDPSTDDDSYLWRRNEIYIIGTNGVPGNYRIYYNEQAPGGIPIGGEFAPCLEPTCAAAAALAASLNVEGLAFEVSTVDPPDGSGGGDPPPIPAPPGSIEVR